MKIRGIEKVDFERAKEFTLTVEMYSDGWQFRLSDEATVEVIFTASDSPSKMNDAFSSFKDLFFENEFFSLPFKKVYAVSHSADFTFVPDEYNVAQCGAEFIEYMSSARTGVVKYSQVDGQEFSAVYRVDDAICDFLMRSFDNPQFVHYSALLIASFTKQNKNLTTRQMIINTHGGEMSIICFNGSQFLLFNQYRIAKFQDALYYILFTWKQLKFNQMEDSILLAGDAAEDAEMIKTLKEYVGRVEIEKNA
jgi:hypothetical protein